jgi:hypothetical protein
MFLTNLDTIAIALFLGSGIILVTLFGILVTVSIKHPKEGGFLIRYFYSLTGLFFVSLLIYSYMLLFSWLGNLYILASVLFTLFTLWFLYRLTRHYPLINRYLFGGCIASIVVQFIMSIVYVISGNILFLLLISLMNTLAVIMLHFLAVLTLTKFPFLTNRTQYE